MSDHDDSARDSPPDLQILGDQITLQPSGFVQPPSSVTDDGKEEALMKHMARFRSEPLQYVYPGPDPGTARLHGQIRCHPLNHPPSPGSVAGPVACKARWG